MRDSTGKRRWLLKYHIIAFFLAMTILICLPFSAVAADGTDSGGDSGEKVFLADTYDGALETADYYNAELASYSCGVGVLRDVKGPTLFDTIVTYSGDLPELSDNDTLYALDVGTESYNDYSTDLQWHHGAIDTQAAWAYSMGSSDVTVAVIDSGVIASHEDLNGQKIDYLDFYTNGTSEVDEIFDPYDNDGHGTHVTGIIAAIAGNGCGGTGVAPGVKILSLKALDTDSNGDCTGSTSDVLTALNYAVDDAGAEVVNMSLGGDAFNQAFQDAVTAAESKGVTVVCAAGNSSTSTKSYPAAYSGAVAVAAVTDYGGTYVFASYSDYGSWVDVAAPGTYIYSTYNESSSSYTTMSGTSMASPVVAGVAALIYSCRTISPNASGAALVLSILKSTTSGTVSKNGYTYGIVNAKNAVMAASASDAPVYSEGAEAAFPAGASKTVTVSSPDLSALGALGDSRLYISVTPPGETDSGYTAYASASQALTLDTPGEYKVKAYAEVFGRDTPVSEARYILLGDGFALSLTDATGGVSGVLYPSYSGSAGAITLSAAGVLYGADPDDLVWDTDLPESLATLTPGGGGTAVLAASDFTADEIVSGTVTVTDTLTSLSASYSVQLAYRDVFLTLENTSEGVTAHLGFSDTADAVGGLLCLAYYNGFRMADVETATVAANTSSYDFGGCYTGWTYARIYLLSPAGLPIGSALLLPQE